jgi:hypothetical protein
MFADFWPSFKGTTNPISYRAFICRLCFAYFMIQERTTKKKPTDDVGFSYYQKIKSTYCFTKRIGCRPVTSSKYVPAGNWLPSNCCTPAIKVPDCTRLPCPSYKI